MGFSTSDQVPKFHKLFWRLPATVVNLPQLLTIFEGCCFLLWKQCQLHQVSKNFKNHTAWDLSVLFSMKLHGMNGDHDTNCYSFWEQFQPVPPIIFLLLFLTLITENKTLPKQANKLEVYIYHDNHNKGYLVWRLVKKLRSRQHYPDKFIAGGTGKDTSVRNTDPPKHSNQTNK